MGFLQNRKVCFNQESLPITYRNFCHKSLVRPKSKFKRFSTHKLQGQFFTEQVRNQTFLGQGNTRKNGPTGGNSLSFCLETLKICLLNEKFYPQMTTIRVFCPQICALFSNFQKRAWGNLPPLQLRACREIRISQQITQSSKTYQNIWEKTKFEPLFTP